MAASAARGGMAGREIVGHDRRLDLEAGSRYDLNVVGKHVAHADRRRRVAPAQPRDAGEQKSASFGSKNAKMRTRPSRFWGTYLGACDECGTYSRSRVRGVAMSSLEDRMRCGTLRFLASTGRSPAPPKMGGEIPLRDALLTSQDDLLWGHEEILPRPKTIAMSKARPSGNWPEGSLPETQTTAARPCPRRRRTSWRAPSDGPAGRSLREDL